MCVCVLMQWYLSVFHIHMCVNCQFIGLLFVDTDFLYICVTGLIACFLNVHPQGATVDYIWSYLTQLVPLVKQREVEDVIGRFPSLFQQVVSGVGASLERRCSFAGYRGQALAVPG